MRGFRVWHNEEYITDKEYFEGLVVLTAEGKPAVQEYEYLTELEDAKVEFYSGKYDKNGREIAKNDILRLRNLQTVIVDYGEYDNMMNGDYWEHGNGWHLIVKTGTQRPATYLLNNETVENSIIIGNTNQGIDLEYQEFKTVQAKVVEIGQNLKGEYVKVNFTYKQKKREEVFEKSFAPPNTKPGDFIQYKAKESFLDNAKVVGE